MWLCLASHTKAIKEGNLQIDKERTHIIEVVKIQHERGLISEGIYSGALQALTK